MSRSDAHARLEGKTVAVVGSGPGVLDNAAGLVDSHDVVVRVNNYKLSPQAGLRCDVHHSFYGTSIRKSREELIADGVTLCMGKLPDADLTTHGLDPAWHRKHGKLIGLDYRPHYARRARMGFWFCDTYRPDVPEFMELFDALGQSQPTTGCAAIHEVLLAKPKSVYLTGFDFFASKLHNVDEPWVEKNLDDPYRHRPERERGWLARQIARAGFPVTCDPVLSRSLSLWRADNCPAAA